MVRLRTAPLAVLALCALVLAGCSCTVPASLDAKPEDPTDLVAQPEEESDEEFDARLARLAYEDAVNHAEWLRERNKILEPSQGLHMLTGVAQARLGRGPPEGCTAPTWLDPYREAMTDVEFDALLARRAYRQAVGHAEWVRLFNERRPPGTPPHTLSKRDRTLLERGPPQEIAGR